MGNSYSFYRKINPLTEKKELSLRLWSPFIYKYAKNKFLKSITKYSGIFSK